MKNTPEASFFSFIAVSEILQLTITVQLKAERVHFVIAWREETVQGYANIEPPPQSPRPTLIQASANYGPLHRGVQRDTALAVQQITW